MKVETKSWYRRICLVRECSLIYSELWIDETNDNLLWVLCYSLFVLVPVIILPSVKCRTKKQIERMNIEKNDMHGVEKLFDTSNNRWRKKQQRLGESKRKSVCRSSLYLLTNVSKMVCQEDNKNGPICRRRQRRLVSPCLGWFFTSSGGTVQTSSSLWYKSFPNRRRKTMTITTISSGTSSRMVACILKTTRTHVETFSSL